MKSNFRHSVVLRFQTKVKPDATSEVKSEVKYRHLKPYDRTDLLKAYEATKNGMSVYRAARRFSVPESTLRDRTRCNVALDAIPGPETLLSSKEEEHLVEQIKQMDDLGYQYTKKDVIRMATDYCISIGKKVRSDRGLSDNWFYAFKKRWPNLKITNLQLKKEKTSSKEASDNYFPKLRKVLAKNKLLSFPERIYNVEETGIVIEPKPRKTVYASSSNSPAIAGSAGSPYVTIIAGANAIGNNIPPFYIFPGKSWNDQFLNDAPAGSSGSMSETGLSNPSVFECYVTKHFAKYANIRETNEQCTLILYDSNNWVSSVTLTEWARQRNVILFAIPSHGSRLRQPLGIDIFCPFICQYNEECQLYLMQNPGLSITKFKVAQLSAKPYLQTLSPINIISAFRKSGIFPFNDNSVTSSHISSVSFHVNGETPALLDDEKSSDDEELESDRDSPTCESENAASAAVTSLK